MAREPLADQSSPAIFAKARDTALRFLGSRPRAYREVVKRLEADQYPAGVIDRVMALMVQYRYVDDEAYAQAYAASRMRHGRYGARRIRQEMRLKGIDPALIEEAIRQAAAAHGEVQTARAWLSRKNIDIKDPRQRKRVTDALLRRGFNYGVIKEAIAAFEGEEDE